MAFKDIIGQDKAINIIGKTLTRKRVPSAYLFAGEYGIGKKLAAINLAKAMNCLKDRDALGVMPASYAFDCCDECASCKKIDAGTHPDFLVIAPEKGEIRVGGIRAAAEALSFRPYEGRTKVVIIDDADAMNQSAANAFLKTLEEPPDESLLILITAQPDRLPETIRSRCSRINFSPLSSDFCEKVIRAGLAKNGKEGELPGRMLSTIARLSMGRPGLALSSNNADMAGMAKERERFIDLLRSILGDSDETWADKEEMGRWLDMVFILLRDMVLTKVIEKGRGKDPVSGGKVLDGEVLLNADIDDLMARIDKTKDIMSIMKIYDKLTLLRRAVDFNLNKAITWNYASSVMKTIMAGA